MKDPDLTFPVQSVMALASLPEQIILLQLRFLAHPLQADNEATQSPLYILSASGAKELVEILQSKLADLARATPALPPGLRH